MFNGLLGWLGLGGAPLPERLDQPEPAPKPPERPAPDFVVVYEMPLPSGAKHRMNATPTRDGAFARQHVAETRKNYIYGADRFYPVAILRVRMKGPAAPSDRQGGGGDP